MVAVGGNAPPSMGYESIALLLSYTAMRKKSQADFVPNGKSARLIKGVLMYFETDLKFFHL